jgi:hypothetical protein
MHASKHHLHYATEIFTATFSADVKVIAISMPVLNSLPSEGLQFGYSIVHLLDRRTFNNRLNLFNSDVSVFELKKIFSNDK